MGRYEPLLGFWGEASAAKRFPRYYRGLRERWMTESRCYFFLSYAQKVVSMRRPMRRRAIRGGYTTVYFG